MRSSVLLVAMLAGAVARAQTNSGPHIACDAPQFDFGTVSDVNAIQHVYVIRNTGDAELVINHVRPSCGCTTTGLPTNTVAPGGSVDLTATLSLHGRSGEQRKTIYIDCNDPQSPQYRLDLNGVVQREVDFRPQQVVLQVSPGAPLAHMDVEFSFNTTNAHAITGINSNNAAFCHVSVSEVHPGHDYTLQFESLPEYKTQSSIVSGSVNVLTDDPAHASVFIPVILQQIRDVVVAPGQLVVSANLPAGTPYTQQILVRNRTPDPLDLLGVTAPTNGVTVTSHQLSPSMYRVEVVFLDPPKELKGKSITIRVQRKGADEESYDVPIQLVGR